MAKKLDNPKWTGAEKQFSSGPWVGPMSSATQSVSHSISETADAIEFIRQLRKGHAILPRSGWICPRCDRVMSPDKLFCECDGEEAR